MKRKWIRDLLKLSAPLLLAGTILCFASGFTVNGGIPGSTAGATPMSVGTSTPVMVLTCGSGATYIDFAITGGTVNTDGCYLFPAPGATASPCASPSPAPNAATKVGYFAATGGSGWQHTPLNYPSYAGSTSAAFNQGWWAVCTAAAMSVSVSTIP